MAKRQLVAQPGPARRAPKSASRPGDGKASARRARTVHKAAHQGAPKQAAGPSGRSTTAAARTTVATAPRVRAPKGQTGRGAAQPGGRRTVELLAHAPDEEGASPTVPSSLDFDERPSAAQSGRAEFEEQYREHHEAGPGMTAGDIDADWASADSVGDEAPGGDNPTPGQNVVEEAGRALGVAYEDEEALQAADKIEDRDRHRWELDPASSDDYQERMRGPGRKKKR